MGKVKFQSCTEISLAKKSESGVAQIFDLNFGSLKGVSSTEMSFAIQNDISGRFSRR